MELFRKIYRVNVLLGVRYYSLCIPPPLPHHPAHHYITPPGIEEQLLFLHINSVFY